MAMVRPAPDIAAPLAAVGPMQPGPMTATVRQTSIFAVLWTVPDPGGYPAAVERGAVERHVLAHFHDRVLVHQYVLGERRQVVELGELLAVPTGPRPTSSPVAQDLLWPQMAE